MALNADEEISSDDALSIERDSLAKAGHMHWFHWLIIILSAMLALVAWDYFNRQAEARAAELFDREVARTVEHITDRMRKYEDALWSGAAAIIAHGGEMTHRQWRSFAENLRLDTKYPGINGIGVIQAIPKDELASHIATQQLTRPAYKVHPEHSESEYLPIVYIEPEVTNLKAIGLDMAHELNRYTAAKKARRTGLAQITGPIVLVQDESSTPGFLFYAPYYRGEIGGSVGARGENFLGMVYAPFVVKKLMDGTLDKDKRQVSVQLADGQNIIYDEHTVDDDDFDTKPAYSRDVEIEMYGRTWQVALWSSKSFRQATSTSQPLFILLGGITIDGLLLALFLFQSRASRRTLSFADRLTAKLQVKAAALAQSNADLESFAYVASHDLKTPLRGIADLTEYLEEDLEDYLADQKANPDVQKNLDRLNVQTGRMDSLIRGILSYSSIEHADELSDVDVAELLAQIRVQLAIGDEQLCFDPSMPVFRTYGLRFQQVLMNLVENAFKYHHDLPSARVDIVCQDIGNHYEFSISDNGPGIEGEYHARIFEAFQTLQSKDKVDSTGIGLAIVKKTVEGLGCYVRVESKLGKGSTFTFSWPKYIEKAGQEKKVAKRKKEIS